MGYWENRLAKSQTRLTSKGIDATNVQLRKYYKKSLKHIIGQFELTYNKLLSSVEKGVEPTPADLYKLDKHWQMQAQLKVELQKLGDETYKVMSKNFEAQYKNIYKSLSVDSEQAFSTLSNENVQQMINQIWCADGKSWSQRIWTNTDKLQQALNDNLIHCVLTGQKTTQLKELLTKQFNVSYNNANTIVRTEMARIQTQSAIDRYKNYGIQQVEILADDAGCDYCGKLHKTRYTLYEKIPVPAHPNCRCCIIPVVDAGLKVDIQLFAKKSEQFEKSNKELTSQKKSVKVELSPAQQEAQSRVRQLQQQGELLFYNLSKDSHRKHCLDLLGDDSDEKLLQYQKMASDFIKKDIDGKDVDGFVSGMDWLFKYEHSTGLFGILSAQGTISTLFKPEELEKYWKQQQKLHKKKG